MLNKIWWGGTSTAQYSIIRLFLFMGLIWAFGALPAQAQWPGIAVSKDGTPISYEVYGSGDTTLVLVHGWNCDARYWRAQLSYLAQKHRVVALDLAGHGHSGMARSRYTMQAFGEDVAAVTKAVDGTRVILVGHSMGGAVIAEAARLMPDRVLGLIGIDTLENIEYAMTRENLEKMTAPLKKDFPAGVREFARGMIRPDTSPGLLNWILGDMSAAPPGVALSAVTHYMTQYITGEAARIFKEIKKPVITVNADLWPVNYEGNRRHMFFFDAIILKNTDHFLMLNRPDAFNPALEKAIQMVMKRRAPPQKG